MDYSILLADLERVLGKGQKRSKDNYAFRCPFCHHRKHKLEVQLITSEKGENPWQCWVCLQRGKSIRSLLTQLQLAEEQITSILQHIPRQGIYRPSAELPVFIQLPKEYKTFDTEGHSSKKALRFLYKRKLTDLDIIKYSIGYCETGEYEGRIIIPSYDHQGRLNYFLARSYENRYPKYKNPPVSKDVVIFENMVNWRLPVILVEGAFDAMAVKRNCIPILGKNIAPSLMERLSKKEVEDIYVALDGDARKRSLSLCEQFLSMDKRVFLVELEEEDPSDMGFEEITKLLSKTQELNLTSLLRLKLNM